MILHSADIVIIGGGILGCSIAYYLSRWNMGRVLLLERRMLAEANTSRAAALLTQARAKTALMPLVRETYQAVADLEAQLGESLGLRKVGSLHVAVSPQRRHELTELVALAQKAGIKAEWITPIAATAMAPWLKLAHNTSVASMPEDGFIDPYVLAHAFARVAKAQGVDIQQNVGVTEVRRAGDQVMGVKTDRGSIACPLVIDAAGAWAGVLA
jgi:4-methylaminobutanoate oxidase (formaldehyde-forming)